MSLTALNSPQLFRCSFSSRKKFHTKRLRRRKLAVSGQYACMLYIINVNALSLANVHNSVSAKSHHVLYHLQEERLDNRF